MIHPDISLACVPVLKRARGPPLRLSAESETPVPERKKEERRAVIVWLKLMMIATDRNNRAADRGRVKGK
jgi:hypothetical protein